jgi:hypothetical protein
MINDASNDQSSYVTCTTTSFTDSMAYSFESVCHEHMSARSFSKIQSLHRHEINKQKGREIERERERERVQWDFPKQLLNCHTGKL